MRGLIPLYMCRYVRHIANRNRAEPTPATHRRPIPRLEMHHRASHRADDTIDFEFGDGEHPEHVHVRGFY